MAVLVTGASGFIGRNLVLRRVADGVDVRAFVLPRESFDAPPRATVVRGDVSVRASVTAGVDATGRAAEYVQGGVE